MRWNAMRWNGGRWNGSQTIVVIPDLKILYNQNEVTVKWQSVLSATNYRYQVSLFPDFRTIFRDSLVTTIFETFTDSEVDNAKRFWRWRPYLDSGITPLAPWSDVGSYWIDTSAAQELELDRNTWMMANPADTGDVYLFDVFPMYQIVAQNLYRIQERNRIGDLLSEFLTVKGNISLFFDQGQFVNHTQFHEIVRFHSDVRTVFLLTFKDTEIGYPMPNIWKVEFMNDPAFSMLAAGRQDLLTGQLNFEEV